MYFQIYLGLCAKWQMADYTISNQTGADLGGGCRGCAPPLRWLAAF